MQESLRSRESKISSKLRHVVAPVLCVLALAGCAKGTSEESEYSKLLTCVSQRVWDKREVGAAISQAEADQFFAESVDQCWDISSPQYLARDEAREELQGDLSLILGSVTRD